MNKDYEKACLRGVRLAFKKYFKMTGGFSLGKAPENYIQGEIASSLAKTKKCFVTLETSVYDTLYDACVERRGKLPRNPHGRIDIVTWWKDGSPRYLIEVKKIRGLDSITDDVRRLCSVLNRSGLKDKGSIRQGLVIVYSQALRKETLKKRFDKISKNSNAVLSNVLGPIKFKDPFTEDSWFWKAACYVVRKNKRI